MVLTKQMDKVSPFKVISLFLRSVHSIYTIYANHLVTIVWYAVWYACQHMNINVKTGFVTLTVTKMFSKWPV